jgi:hypothetical protein
VVVSIPLTSAREGFWRIVQCQFKYFGSTELDTPELWGIRRSVEEEKKKKRKRKRK